MCADLTESQWHMPPVEGEWDALRIVGHLFDVDVVYGFRWRLVLTEDQPAYPGYDEKLWSELPRPQPDRLLTALSGIRAVNLALLRATPVSSGTAAASTPSKDRNLSP